MAFTPPGFAPAASNNPVAPNGSTNVPGSTPLQIGSVIFNSEECPSELAFPIATHMTVTDLIGGGRVIQTFGNHPEPVTWSGRIWGPNVAARISALRQLLVAGAEVPLSWGSERYYCVVKQFTPKYIKVDAEYTITVEITRDNNGALTTSNPTTVDSQVGTLVSNAGVQSAALSSLDSSSSPLNYAGNALNAGQGSLSNAAFMAQQVTNVQAAIAGAGPLAQLAGPQLTSVLGVVNYAQGFAAAYVAATPSSASYFSAVTQLATTFTLIGKNITQGQAANSVQVYGGTFAELAATHYNNADLGPELAAANGSVGLRLPAGTLSTIILPPFAHS